MRFLTCLLAMATGLFAATLPMTQDKATLAVNATVMGEKCGWVGYKGSVVVVDIFKSGNKPYDFYDIVNSVTITNKNCGICSFYADHECAGAAPSWWGGPGPRRKIPDSYCYFCLDIRQFTKDVPARHKPPAHLSQEDQTDTGDQDVALVEVDDGTTEEAAVHCGHAWWENGTTKQMFKNKCTAFDSEFKFSTFENMACRSCMFWDEDRDCNSSPRYFKGQGDHTFDTAGAVAYLCI